MAEILASRFEVWPASPLIGAEIEGVDLTRPVDEGTAQALREAFQRLTGITEAEGQALLPLLLNHASSPDYTVSFGWKPGDFVLWDNLATWHYAVNDYDGPRVYRKVIGG